MQEMQDYSANNFDYSLVDNSTADFLKSKLSNMNSIAQDTRYRMGKELSEAQNKLANHYQGVFTKWFESLGLDSHDVYFWIKEYNFSLTLKGTKQIANFNNASKTLKDDVLRKSAEPEAVQRVLSGDITTHKEYKELEKKLKQSEEANKTLDGLLSEKADTISALEQQVKNKPKPEVVEKEVEVEKIPDDYHYYKGNFESIKAVNERLQNENEQIRKELKSYSNKPDVDNSELLAKKEKLEAEISTLKNVSGLGEEINDFINRVSSYEYQIDMKQLASKRDVLKSIHDSIGGLKKWCSDFENELPTQNFIEGEINHE